MYSDKLIRITISKRTILFCFCAIAFVFLFTTESFATDYYVRKTGSGSACTQAEPCLTIAAGIAAMSSGDTLIVGDGIYSRDIIINVPSGNYGADAIDGTADDVYTTIIAENDGKVTVTDDTNNYAPLYLNSDYVSINGFRFISTTDPDPGGQMQAGLVITDGRHHNKIFNSAVSVTPCTNGECLNRSTIQVNGSFNLLEDVWAWGGGRYKVLVYGGNGSEFGRNNILRRVVVRHDREWTGGWDPQAGISIYQASDTVLENVIILDSDQIAWYDDTPDRGSHPWYGAIAQAKGTRGGPLNILGTIAFNYLAEDSPAFHEGGGNNDNPLYPYGDVTIRNFSAINGGGGFYFAGVGGEADRDITVDHVSVVDTLSLQYANYQNAGCGVSSSMYYDNPQPDRTVVTNSIFTQIKQQRWGGHGLHNVKGANDYNSLFNNFSNYSSGNEASTIGSHDITSIDPLATSLLYPVRIEEGSPLKGAGSDGSDIGPTIMFRIGKSGTLYGQPGYMDTTAEPLWPWPNQDRIKADMSSYPTNWPADNMPSPTRGFTASGAKQLDGVSPVTLTSYIWEAFGNQMPKDLYSETGGQTPPGSNEVPAPINGVCGDASGQSFSVLNSGSANLCAAGTVASFAGSGPWTWGCNGSSGGTDTASNACSALLLTPTNYTYYVSPEGSNGNDGSQSSPWQTLQYAADRVVAGDTVGVADGNYAGFFVETSGSSGAPITFKALGAGVNITSRNSRTADGINIESWNETPSSYITIDGFNVFNQTRMGIRAIGGTGIIIKNCTVHNNASDGIFSGWTPSIQVLDNTTYANGNSSFQHNIYLSNATSDNCIVRGNTVYSSGAGNGIQLNGDWQEGGDGFIDNCIVENNIIHDNTQKGLSLISVRYGVIRNNIIYNNGISAGGIHIVQQLDSHYSIDNVVVNNTIDEPSIATIRINSGNTGNIVFNNVSLGSNGIVFEGSGNYQSNNSTSTAGFINRAEHDYRLLTDSPAKDFGLSTYMSIAAPATDHNGVARPQNGNFDAGAFEYGTSADRYNWEFRSVRQLN